MKTLTTKKECSNTFGENGKYLLFSKKMFSKSKKGEIYPIKITIDNKSDQPWHLSLNNIELKKAPIKNVLERLHYWTGTRMLVTSVFLLPVAAVTGYIALGFVWGSLLLAGYTGIPLLAGAGMYTGFFLLYSIPATAVIAPIALGINLSNENRKITKQVKKTTWVQKSDHQSMIIQPSQIKTAFIFVQERDYKNNFAITLQQNETDNKLLFNVQLPAV